MNLKIDLFFTKAIFRTTKIGKKIDIKKRCKICKFQNDFIVLIFNYLQIHAHYQIVILLKAVIYL